MKKFISMVMAAAMVVSLVPATAFAYEIESSVKVLDVAELAEEDAEKAKKDGIDAVGGIDYPELQITITNDDYTADDTDNDFEFTLKLDNAKFDGTVGNYVLPGVTVDYDAAKDAAGNTKAQPQVVPSDIEDDEVTFTLKFGAGKLVEDDKIIVDLKTVKTTKTSAGSEATVTVDSDDLGIEKVENVFAVVQDNVLTIDVDDTVDVAEEETAKLTETITIEAATGYLPSSIDKTVENSDGTDRVYDLKLKLSSGFEFVTDEVEDKLWEANKWEIRAVDEDEAFVNVVGNQTKIKITGLVIEATTAKVGDVATLTVSAADWDKASIDVATVVGEGLTIEVDEDEDVPEMWSGVAVGTNYLTDDVENEALTITIKETVAGAYSEKDEVELVMPEGVWVVGATAAEVEGEYANVEGAGNNWQNLLADAYKEGDHQSFVFKKRVIDETTTEAFEFDVDLILAADPGFVGDVVVELLVDGESAGEVTIATFKAPMIVEAQANDLIIDYRNTEVPSDIVIKEAEAGLWAEGLKIGFGIDKFGADCFEDDMVYTVNEESDMEIDGEDDYLFFEVDAESNDEAAVVTISNISLYMERNIPAGSYDLTMYGGVFAQYNGQRLFAADEANCTLYDDVDENDNVVAATHNDEKECFIDDVADYSDVVKEGFVNVVTAGRDADDASFTTKVVVPVGAMEIVAGESVVALDVPAYINAAGYTMLPVRAVAVALGIHTNNVIWDQATKTVTILYGQRIITMQVGSKVINVNGSAIPASAAVEIVNGRTFLGLRDLATALGVVDITWDAATQTATLNGNK